jgi:DNA modification methylase
MSLLLAQADARQIPLADASVHMVVSSPPYFGLRLYETGAWQGGDPACPHTRRPVNGPKDPTSTLIGRATNQNHEREPGPSPCPRCGAVRVDASLGNEHLHDCLAWARQEPPCGQCYVCALRGVMQEVWRVLRNDGVLFLVIGDSYAGSSHGGFRPGSGCADGYVDQRGQRNRNGVPRIPGLPPKSLIGIPHRVVLALQADGWIFRSDIIWHKLNGMPNSQQDRPTSSHEHIPVFTKQPRYFWDQEAIRESASANPVSKARRQRADTGTIGTTALRGTGYGQSGQGKNVDHRGASRTIRDVWSLAGDPWHGEHHAAYPLEIPRRAILAGTSQHGVCSVPHCGAPWRRVVERCESPPDLTQRSTQHYNTADRYGAGNGGNDGLDQLATRMREGRNGWKTIGWEPTCPHRDAPVVPAIVLDPFCGSATTLQAARELGRHAIGLDLSWTYLHRESRTRLGLAALAAWQHGEAPRETPVDDLPLFAKETPNDL